MERKQPKPILTIRVHEAQASQAKIAELGSSIEKMGMSDSYYILIIPSGLKETKIDVFYEKNFNEVKYKELKAFVKRTMETKAPKDEDF